MSTFPPEMSTSQGRFASILTTNQWRGREFDDGTNLGGRTTLRNIKTVDLLATRSVLVLDSLALVPHDPAVESSAAVDDGLGDDVDATGRRRTR